MGRTAVAELLKSLQERDRRRVEVDTARRTLGRAGQMAREATGYHLNDLADTLGKSPAALAAFEAGDVRDEALADAIENALAAEVLEAERNNDSGDTAIVARIEAIKAALDAFLAARRELQKQAPLSRAAERRLAARIHAVTGLPRPLRERKLSKAVRQVEDGRMLALKAARNEAGITAKEFSAALAQAGIAQPDGRPYGEAKVHEAESPDRKDRRPPTQEYVNAAIKVLAGRRASGRELDALRAVDLSIHELKALKASATGSRQPDRPPRRRRTGPRMIAVAPTIVAVAEAVALVLILLWPRPVAPPRGSITSPRANAIVSSVEFAAGTASAFGGRSLWLVVEPQVHHAYHPQEQVEVAGGEWRGYADFGDLQTPSRARFALDLVVADAAATRVLWNYVQSLPRPGPLPYPGFTSLPKGSTILAQVIITRG